ncbi:tn3 transposase DDE domain protein [Rickettsia endosymbiont of Ixodes pacificus]|nr:tn3 transposase DDE domain protein [Rickettsia endosymbiont of Ixodes pacificus]
MVYINTLMLQQILVESSWVERMSNEDKRAISPLISEHINPYGSFSLDLNKRLAINIDQTLFTQEAASI